MDELLCNALAVKCCGKKAPCVKHRAGQSGKSRLCKNGFGLLVFHRRSPYPRKISLMFFPGVFMTLIN